MVLTATAASSSQIEQSSDLVSFRDLCQSLETFGPRSSKVLLRSQLRQIIPVLQSCGETFPSSLQSSKAKASTDSVTLTSGKVLSFDEPQRELHKIVAQLHKIDENDVAVLLRLFFDSDDSSLDLLSTSSNAHISPLQQRSGRRRRGARAEDLTTRFFDSFTAFYFEERLYILRCISALIRIADDPYHYFSDAAKEILDDFADQDFALRCLLRIQHLCQQELVDDVREVPRYSVFWVKHGLREQLSLLEVFFLLFYSRLEATAVIVKAIFDLIAQTDFGKEQATGGFFDTEASQLVDCMASFLTLIAVEALELEKCLEGLDLHTSARPREAAAKQLIDAPEVIASIIDYLQASTQVDTLRGPLLFSFAFVLNRVDAALGEWKDARPTENYPEHLKALQMALDKRGGAASLWQSFVSAALTPALDLFGTFNGMLQSPLFRTDSSVSNLFSLAISSTLALRAVFKGLLLSLTQLIRPEYIQDYDGMIRVWQNTFSSPSAPSDSCAALCAQFWESDYRQAEKKAVLTMAMRRFPVSFTPLLRLCRALSGDSRDFDDDSLRACTAVLGFMAQLNTLTQVMPASPSITLPYEPVETSSDVLVYRATRTIQLFGKHLVIPAGTTGRMVSQPDQAPVVIVWELPGSGYSGWRLLRDVLANFIGLLDVKSVWDSGQRSSVNQDDSSIFGEEDCKAEFSSLAPEEMSGIDGDVVEDALDLLAAVLEGGRYLSATLINHLNGEDIGVVDPWQPTAVSTKPSLVDIALRILDQALASPTRASRVIQASLRLITLLVPTKPAAIWQTMRSSNALVGTSGLLHFSSQSAGFSGQNVSVLAYDISTGRFMATLALLDLHAALLLDLLRTQYSSSLEALQLQVEVIGRATHFIINQVWTEHQNWKYVSIRQQAEIGRRCASFLQSICQDESLRRSTVTRKLVHLVDGCFASATAPSLYLSPLLNTIARGQTQVDGLQRGLRQVEAEAARQNLLAQLRFSITIMSQAPWNSTFATVVFASSANSQSNLVKAVADLTLMSHELPINSEALKIMTCLCRATTENGADQAVTLVGHLGSLLDIEKWVDGLLGMVDSETILAVAAWNLLAVIVDTQPALATLLLTGRHLAESVEKQLATLDPSNTPSTTLSRSAIEIAKAAILDWKGAFDRENHDIAVLEGAIKFLVIAWKHALAHRDAFSALRTDQEFWTSIAQLIQADAGPLPELPPPTFIVEEGKSDASDDVCRFALKRMCTARALTLLTSDLRLRKNTSFDRIMSLLAKAKLLESALDAAVRFHCDTLMHDDVLARFAKTFPEISMDDFALPARCDDYDFRQPFGDSYVYDIEQLQKKLQGFAPTVEDEVEGEETQLAALQHAVLLVAGMNLNWCIADAQSCLLDAWTALLDAIIGPSAEADKQTTRALQTSTLSAWTYCAKITSEEDVDSKLTAGIHSQRISLLTCLLKLCWRDASKEEGNSDDSMESLRDALQQVEQIFTHPLFRIEDAVRNRAAFPTHVFEMVYLCSKKYSRSRKKMLGSKHGSGDVLLTMQQSVETLTLHTISCFRAVIDVAGVIPSTGELEREQSTERTSHNIALLTSILHIMLESGSGVTPHIWAPRLQTTSLLSAAMDLFSRSPFPTFFRLDQAAEDVLASGSVPLFMQQLLPFFFNLASQRSTAELLVLSGVINALCQNSLASLMDSSDEAIPPRITNTSYENPSHACWLQMLQVMVALVPNLDGSVAQRFMQSEAWSFFRVFEKTLNLSLEVHIGGMTAMMLLSSRRYEPGQQDVFRINQLEEIDLVLKLYLHIIRARIRSPRPEDGASSPFKSYVAKVSVQLQEFVHLLQHPRELTALVRTGEAKAKAGHLDQVKALLTSACTSIVAALWEIGQGDRIICMEPSDWDLQQTLIHPTISTTPSSPASTGTLLDLATYLAEALLRQRCDIDKEQMAFLVSSLEQTASLCTTQLVMAAYIRPNNMSTAIRKNLETGLGRDVRQGLESAKGAVQDANEDTSFLDVLLAFHLRWLHSGD